MVKVDSSFYAIPTPTVVHNWALRTPDDFVMNVKASRLFTGHMTEAKMLGKAARELIGNRQRLMYKNAGQDLQDFLWQQFYDTLAPLRALGKLGLIHFQFPPSVIWARKSMEHVEHCIERMRGDTVSIEFRHKSWWETAERSDYEYSEVELSSLAGNLVRLAEKVRRTHAIFNNCNEDKGQRNAIRFIDIVQPPEQ
nr:DUF72 domain-containing protein [Variovorax sp.]